MTTNLPAPFSAVTVLPKPTDHLSGPYWVTVRNAVAERGEFKGVWTVEGRWVPASRIGARAVMTPEEYEWASRFANGERNPRVHMAALSGRWPMSERALAAWLAARGVAEGDLAARVAEYRGKTEDEMDEMYDGMHGSMA